MIREHRAIRCQAGICFYHVFDDQSEVLVVVCPLKILRLLLHDLVQGETRLLAFLSIGRWQCSRSGRGSGSVKGAVQE